VEGNGSFVAGVEFLEFFVMNDISIDWFGNGGKFYLKQLGYFTDDAES
jgi:hypothetical protein